MSRPKPINGKLIKSPPKQPQAATKHSDGEGWGSAVLLFFCVPISYLLGVVMGYLALFAMVLSPFLVLAFMLAFPIILAILIVLGLTSVSVFYMVLGNYVLRIVPHSHYTSTLSACIIGVFGCIFGFINLIIFTGGRGIPSIIHLGISVVAGAATGAFGCHFAATSKIGFPWQGHEIHLPGPGDMDMIHAAIAGGIGAATPGLILFIVPILIQSTFIGVLMLPLLLKIEYAFVRARETITLRAGNVFSGNFFSCVCVSTKEGGDGDSINNNNWV